VISAFILVVSACSTTQQAYLQNVKMYFASDNDTTLTMEDVKEATVDLIYVRNGDRPQATMALAFIESNQYKWLSQDGVIFITENGRLVRSSGLDKNLIFVSNLSTDSLKDLQSRRNVPWNRVIDTEYGDYGVALSSQMSASTDQLISIQTRQLKTTKYTESVSYQSSKYGKDEWTNTFWFHQESGQLLKSSQKTSSQSDNIEIVYLSRAMRLLED